ncbi:MAG: phosphoribosylglycinamide formyltransferase, partial [Deltaproteobacteria bacterium]|nr:phosphoribosylglycinamide formyltransferase [Deltaproteobacteria bacterium]
EIVFVGTDNPDASGLERGRKHGIPTFTVDYSSIIQSLKKGSEKIVPPKDFDIDDLYAKQTLFSDDADPETVKCFMVSRAIAEAKLLEAMAPYPFDLLVLAGFMRTLSPYFIDRVNPKTDHPRIMNIHPALLPSFPGTDGYGDTFRYGCKVGGCTVHFIDYGEDSGPIIGQKAFQIEPDDTLATIRKKGIELEWEVYPECIQLFAQSRLKIVNRSYPTPDGKKIQRRIVEIV